MSHKSLRGSMSTGVAALVLLAVIYGLTAVMARYFSAGTGVFEQWYLRYGIAFLFCLVLFRKKIRFRAILSVSKQEWLTVAGRSLLGSVIAVALYTLAVQRAKIGPVAFMQVLPVTALLGIVLFKERVSKARIGLILLSFLGALIVVVPSLGDIAGFSFGEVLSFLSAVCFSFQFVTRKWQTGELNNYELTLIIVGIGTIVNYLLSVGLYHRWFATGAPWSPKYTLLLVASGFLSAAMNFLVNYGFEHVSAVAASIILNLEEVFAPIFGYIFYRETLSVRETIGGLIILLAVVAMSRVGGREQAQTEPVPSPD